MPATTTQPHRTGATEGYNGLAESTDIMQENSTRLISPNDNSLENLTQRFLPHLDGMYNTLPQFALISLSAIKSIISPLCSMRSANLLDRGIGSPSCTKPR